MEKQEEAHKELHKAIFECSCKPWRKDKGYCINCQILVQKFMYKYGAGVLTRDKLVEDLEKLNTILVKDNISLNKILQSKIKRVEELKRDLETGNKPKRNS